MSYLTFEKIGVKEGEETTEGVIIDDKQLCYVKYDTYRSNNTLTNNLNPYLPIHIQTLEQKKKLLIDYNFLVVLIHADWCHPCQTFKPKFMEYAKTNLAKAQFAMENVDLLLTPDISAVPSLLVYKKGKLIKMIKGGNLEQLTYELPPM